MPGAILLGLLMAVTYEDFDPNTGTRTKVHEVEGKVAFEKVFDAEPFLEHAAAERAASQGERWGEGRKVGTIPMAVLGQFMRQDGGLDVKRLEAWLRANPAFVSYEPFLKVRA